MATRARGTEGETARRAMVGTERSATEAATLRTMAGEGLHKVGEDGVRRAKKWLDATTRVRSSWTVYDDSAVTRLTFGWPNHSETFSYDLGGILYGGEFDHQSFLAESKKYSSDSGQGAHFDKFLAQSYVALREDPRLSDNFMWITWAPFRVTTWSQISDPEKIVDALTRVDQYRSWVFGSVSPEDAEKLIDFDIVRELASRMWMIVLSDRQERLVISDDDRSIVIQSRVKQGLV